MLISYENIAKSVDYYDKCGFTQIETPWWVSEDTMMLTSPSDRASTDLLYKIGKNNKCLVASAEQGFLYLATKGHLAKGTYQSIGPCFRDEPWGPGRCNYFMKNELIIIDNTSETMLNFIIETAMAFFNTISDDPSHLHVLKTDIGVDIMYKEHEIGSYGIRHTPVLSYIYGTGIAEPRFSHATKAIKES